MKSLSILLIFLTSFFIRLFRWLSIVQQKEYRFDRLVLFLKTAEGKKELLRLVPKKKDFSRTGLKRPKITFRILVVVLVFSVLSFFFFGFVIIKISSFAVPELAVYLLFGFLLWLLIYLLIIPLIVFLSILPTTILSSIKVFTELLKAKRKVKKSKPIIIGITGSYGKTSTKILLAEVLEKKYTVFKTPKSFNTKFSVARSINKGFKNQEIMIVEYAAYKVGEIKTLTSWFKPNLAVITGLTKQHLGLFGNIESIIKAKAELVKSLNLGSTVICNGDDKGAIKICKVGAELNPTANGNIKIIEANNSNEDSRIIKAGLNKMGKLFFVWNGQQVNTNFMGMHYLEIIRMVILVAKKFELSDKEIVDAISNFIPDDKFIFSYELASGNFVVDDGGTSNPKGFEAAIKLSSKIVASKKILITSGIVDLGDESEDIHEELAKQAKEVFDKVLYVGKQGNKQFLSVFGANFIGEGLNDYQSQIIKFLSNLINHEMILIEGRIPGWIKKYLK